MHPIMIIHASTVRQHVFELRSISLTKFLSLSLALAVFAPIALAILKQAVLIVA
jgi:hypothetical protein